MLFFPKAIKKVASLLRIFHLRHKPSSLLIRITFSCINFFLKQSSIFFALPASLKLKIISSSLSLCSLPYQNHRRLLLLLYCVRFLSFTSHCFGFVWKIILSDLHIFIYLWEGLILHVMGGWDASDDMQEISSWKFNVPTSQARLACR